MAVTSAQVQELYVALLGRAADKAGLDYWVSQINAEGSTLTLENVRANFVNEQAEYAATYGNLARADLVETIYTNLFERTPTAAEIAYWVQDGVSADQLVVAFLNGASAADRTVVTNKVFVADAYTTAAGASFNATAAADIISKVDGNITSVNTAISSLQTGALPGQVAGQAQVQALVAAQNGVVSFESSNKAAVEKLVADFKADSNVATTNADGIVAADDFATKLNAAKQDAADARLALGTTDTVAVLTAKAADAQKVLDAAAAKLTVAERDLVAKYQAAVTADKAATGATAEQEAAAKAGLGVATGFAAAVTAANTAGVTFGSNDGAGVWEAYVGTAAAPATDAVRAKIAEAFKDVSFFTNTFKAAGDAEFADVKAEKALTDATTALNNATNGPDYLAAFNADAAADKLVVDVTAANALKAQVDAIDAAYTAAKAAITTADTAITDFNNASATTELVKVALLGLTADPAVKETFYFAEKAATAQDINIDTFAKGDAIVLGAGLSFGGNALAAGNNGTLEYFLVQDGADAKLVIETAVFGSANTVLTGADASPDAAVITLTGVSVADLQVANGVVVFA